MADDIIYQDQDFELTMPTELTNEEMATTDKREIWYLKPGASSSAELSASLVSSTTKLRVDITNVINDIGGDWFFRTYVEDSVNSKQYPGIVIKFNIKETWQHQF